MPSLKPVLLADLQLGRPGVHEFEVRSARSVDWVWGELTSSAPLHWCRAVRSVRWTSPVPYGPGTTRQVTLAPGVSADEIFFYWDETGTVREKAFYVQSLTVPGVNRIGEKYRVTEHPDGGSVFTWTLLVEPAGGQRAVRLGGFPTGLIAKWLERDTARYFGAG